MTEVLNNLKNMRHTSSYKTLNNISESEFSHVPSVITCTLPEVQFARFLLEGGLFPRRGFPLQPNWYLKSDLQK